VPSQRCSCSRQVTSALSHLCYHWPPLHAMLPTPNHSSPSCEASPLEPFSAGMPCRHHLGLQLPSLAPCGRYALVCPCVLCGHTQHLPCPAQHPTPTYGQNFPLHALHVMPSSCASLSLRHAPPEHTKLCRGAAAHPCAQVCSAPRAIKGPRPHALCPHPAPRCSIQATTGCPITCPHHRPPIADQTVPSHCCTPLHRFCAHRDAMGKRLPPRVPRSAPCWLPPLSHPSPPPLALCSPTTLTVPMCPFGRLERAFLPHGTLAQSPLQRGTDSRIAPKCVASHQVATAATVPEPPHYRTRACTPPLYQAFH
jgi:hypothetical protein